jgi:hypothetical protein
MSIVKHDKDLGFHTTTLPSQFYFRVDILLACEIHLLDHIISVSVDVWDHITCFNPAIFLQKNLYQCQKCDQSYMYVSGIVDSKNVTSHIFMCQEW